MNNSYEHINFEVFSDVPEVPVSPDEKQRLMRPFDQRASVEGTSNVKSSGQRGRRASALAAACLILCLAATPLGDKTWAAVRQAFMGIGQYLGMSQQDDYATVIDQTQTKNGVTVTLCEAIGSDHELRISFQATKDGKSVTNAEAELEEYSINGISWDNGLETTGTGPFGTDLPEEQQDESLQFWGAFFENFEMPLNPLITLKIRAAGENFDFSFVLENEAIKAATKTVDINKTVIFHGKPIILKQLVITPIDQVIKFENPEGMSTEDLWNLILHGTDQNGDAVTFTAGFGDYILGERDNKDETTYELDQNVETYTLRVYDEELMTRETLWCDEAAISDEFTIQVK